MERLIRIGFVLLVLSLTLNMALFSRVGRLSDELNNNFNSFNSELQTVRSMSQHNSDRINQAVNTIETEQRWITPVTFTVVNHTGSNAEVQLSWVVKDYPAGSPVTFHYRKQGDAEFISQQAESMGDGRFAVQLKEKLNTEPKWKIGISYIERKNGESQSSIAPQDATAAERPNVIEYYITVKDGARLKASEIISLGLDNISEGLYAPLSTEVQIDQERAWFTLYLVQARSDPKQAKLARAFLEAYDGDKQLVEQQLILEEAKPDENVRMFNTEWHYSGKSVSRVLLRVEYENGKQFKKEITGRI